MSPVTAPTIRATLPGPLDTGWNRLDGLEIDGSTVTIHPEHWLKFENPTWVVCDWKGVRANLLPRTETADEALEQTVLEYVANHGRVTADPAEVLNTAWQVYSYLFRDELLPVAGLEEVSPEHLRMLREAATLMSLNRVEDTGHISNVSPTWFFGIAVPLAFGLSDDTGQFIDELYHGMWFNETRRLQSVKAHAALGGRLVHGCQSSPQLSGGVVAPYGTNMETFTSELAAMRPEWITAVRNSAGRNPR